MLRSIRNTARWIVFVPLVAVIIGLVFATLADRLGRGEPVAKSMIFLPMAISFVGAAVIFRLIYSYRPEGFGTNIGLLNAIKQGLGQDPVPWLPQQPWNNLLLMVIMVWMQTGLRHGRPVGGHQVHPRRDHRGGADRRRVGVAGLPPHHRPDHPARRSSW